MKKRMILMLAAVAVFVATIGAVKYGQVKKSIAQFASFQPPPEAVTTVVTREDPWPSDITAIGTAAAVHGVVVSADLPGIVAEIHFESGRPVRQGAVLVVLDTREERAQLAAAEAQENLSRVNFQRAKDLVGQQVLSRADYDKAAAEEAEAVARVGEIRATIERKTIRAPFTGLLGIRQVNLGQYLAGGAPIVPLQSLDPIYVNFSVPQQEVARAAVGGRVQVTAESAPGRAPSEYSGAITAVDSVVNEATRNVELQATLANPDGKLKPGMFVETRIVLPSNRAVIALPASAISYAPYGDSVFVVGFMKGPNGQVYRGVRQQIVKVGPARGDQVAILSGLGKGEEVVTSGVFKLRNGAAVQVNNKATPGNDPAPKPEDS
ncbi:MAG TPA: efflux RND transporter periplasmic adaptor subunit [Thermoanaerobaculia bacterium]|nr:efflux RND transporter periplasmic adaptor subunit [Thermoanaerobaculia bacterium]